MFKNSVSPSKELSEVSKSLYLVFLFAVVTMSTLGYTSSSFLYKIVVVFGSLFAVVKLLLQKYSTKYLVISLFLLSFGFVEVVTSKRVTIFLTVLLLIAAKGISEKRIMSTFLAAKISGLILMVSFVALGIFKVQKHLYYKMSSESYIQRIVINGSGTTVLHLSVITCFVLFFYIKRGRVNFIYYILCFLCNCFAFSVSYSTMGFLVGFISLLLFGTIEYSQYMRRKFISFACFYIPLFILFTLTVSLMYSRVAFVDKLDRLFQGRIYYNHFFLTNYPFSIFGFGMLSDEGNFDNSYVYIWVVYGALTFSLLFGALQVVIKDRMSRLDWVAIAVIFVYLLAGISESFYPSAAVNPSLFFLLCLFDSEKSKKNAKRIQRRVK